jgi:hypothetical protein
MIKTICFALIVSLVFVYSSCGGSDSDDAPTVKKGNYSYVIADSTGKSWVEGMMRVDTIKKQTGLPSMVVTGSYTITMMTTDTTFTGKSALREGSFIGYFDKASKMININTNPQVADANIFINAYVSSNNMKGGWYYSTFTRSGGRTEGGLFKATRK